MEDKGTAKQRPAISHNNQARYCVSVDQLQSSTQGVIGQLQGIPTIKRYEVAIPVFIDHCSGLEYVHLQKSTTAIETVEVKDVFERCAASQGVYIHYYHAYNGRFADNLFRQAVARKSQTLSFCRVSAHFQNGVAERRIRNSRIMQDA